MITVPVLDLVFQTQFNRQSERKTHKTFKQNLVGTTYIFCKYRLSFSHTHACTATHNLMHTLIRTHTHTRIYLIYTCVRVSVCACVREITNIQLLTMSCMILLSIHGPYVQIILHAFAKVRNSFKLASKAFPSLLDNVANY